MDRIATLTSGAPAFAAPAPNSQDLPTGIDANNLYRYRRNVGTNWNQIFSPSRGRWAFVSSPTPSDPSSWANFKAYLSEGGSQQLYFNYRDAANKNFSPSAGQQWVFWLPGVTKGQAILFNVVSAVAQPFYRLLVSLALVSADDGESVGLEVYSNSNREEQNVYFYQYGGPGEPTTIKLWYEKEDGIAVDSAGDAEIVNSFTFRYNRELLTIGQVFTDEHDVDWIIEGISVIGRREFMQVIAKLHVPSDGDG